MTTALWISFPRNASAISFILLRTMAEISSGAKVFFDPFTSTCKKIAMVDRGEGGGGWREERRGEKLVHMLQGSVQQYRAARFFVRDKTHVKAVETHVDTAIKEPGKAVLRRTDTGLD